MNQLFLDQITADSSNAEYYAKRVQSTVSLAPRFDGLDLSDVSSMQLYTSEVFNLKSEVNFNLKEEAKASRLPHKLAQHFGVKFVKKQSYDKSSLTYTGIIDDDGNGRGITIMVQCPKPSNCRSKAN